MKRLETHQKRVLTRNLVLISLIFLIVLFFILTTGIKFLLNAAVFVSQLTNKNKPQITLTQKSNFFGDIDINDIPSATNSSSIIISGRLVNYDLVDFYLNSKKIKEVEAIDNFEQQIDDLINGNNEIYLVAKSKNNSSTKKTTTYQVIVKKEKPNLEITQPKDGETISTEEVKIIGKTDKEVIIDVNNFPVVVNALGEFQTSVKLNPGENKINISAQDIAGNMETKTLTLVYEKD